MDTISIRNIRGATLRARAQDGRPLAITNNRVLIGVLIPVEAAWVEHLIDYNWSHVRRSIAEGEQAIAAEPPLGLDHLIGDGDGAGQDQPDGVRIPLVAALAGQTVALTTQSKTVLARLQGALAAPGQPAPGSEAPAVRTIRIGDISADAIERAGAAGQTLALTHDRQLIGMLIPVTQGLVEFLIDQNLSRVMYDIEGEKAGGQEQMTTVTGLRDYPAARPGDENGSAYKTPGRLRNADSAGRMSST